MWGEDAKEWRRNLLAMALRYLPVSVHVYLNSGAYCVRDGSGRIIYADDLAPAEFDAMIAAWAELLIPADAEQLVRRFCLAELENLARRGVRGERLLVRRRYDGGASEVIAATVRLWGDAADRAVELRFEPADARERTAAPGA